MVGLGGSQDSQLLTANPPALSLPNGCFWFCLPVTSPEQGQPFDKLRAGGVWGLRGGRTGLFFNPHPKRKWGRHCCQPHTRLLWFRSSWATAFPKVASVQIDPGSALRHPVRPVPALLPSLAVLPLTSPEVPEHRRSSPGVSLPAWWSRQAVVPARKPFPPPGGSATASSFACPDFHSAAPKRCLPVVRLGRPEAVNRLCASHCICGSLGGSEECAKRVFRYCCGHRCRYLEVSVFPFNPVVSRWIFKFAFSLSMT